MIKELIASKQQKLKAKEERIKRREIEQELKREEKQKVWIIKNYKYQLKN